MKKFIYIILLSSIVLLAKQGFGQYSGQLYFLENLPQSNLMNPAITPRANLYIGFPGFNTVLLDLNTNLSVSTFVQKDGSGGFTYPTKNDFDFSELYRRLGKAAYVKTDLAYTTFMFGWRSNKSYFTVAINERFKNKMAMPSDLFRFIEVGLQGTYDFSPLTVKSMYYREYSFGYSRYFSEKLRIGAHAKLLQGIFSTTAGFETFQLETTKDKWSVDIDGTVNVSAPDLQVYADSTIDNALNTDAYNDYEIMDWVNAGALNFSNPGFAIDLGMHYAYNDRFSFSLSVNDLGFIKWNSGVNNLNVNSKFDFKGLDVNDDKLDDLTGDDSDIAQEMTDSIINSVTYGITNDGFTTAVPTLIHIGGQYHVNHSITAGLLSRTTLEKNVFDQEFILSGNFNFWHVFTGVLNYNLSVKKGSSAGFGFALRGGPAQFYLMLDNIPLHWANTTVIGTDSQEKYPLPYKNVAPNVMVGINLIFGANGFQNEPMIDAYSEF